MPSSTGSASRSGSFFPRQMSRPDWTVHRLDSSLGRYADGWDEVRLRLFGANPMLASEFINALLGQFGTGREWLAILREEGVVSGMCIVQRRRAGLWRSFLPAQTQIGPTLLQGGEHAQ